MKKWLRHVPNFLSLLRAVLCPVSIWLFTKHKFSPCFILFLVACLTDYLDGYCAKRLQAQSRLGSFLDPLSDKFLAFSFFSLLMVQESCPAWFLGLLVAVTLFQGVGCLALKQKSFGPLRIGKINTACQFFWVGLLLFDLSNTHFRLEPNFVLLGYSALSSLQILVFFRYLYRVRGLLVRLFPLDLRGRKNQSIRRPLAQTAPVAEQLI